MDDTVHRMTIKLNQLDEEICNVVPDQAESGHDGRQVWAVCVCVCVVCVCVCVCVCMCACVCVCVCVHITHVLTDYT